MKFDPSSVPTIGRRVDDAGIQLLKRVLAQMESGEALSVALVAEKRGGDVIIAFSPGVGDRMKLCGAASVLHGKIVESIVGGPLPDGGR